MFAVTNHAKRRMHGRIGVTKGNATKHAAKVLREGIRHEDTVGALHKWMDGEFLKYRTANNMRYYAGKLYIFANEILITVLNPSDDIDEKLQEYVKEPAYARYCSFRKNKSNKQVVRQKASQRQNKEKDIFEGVCRYASENYPDIIITRAEMVKPWLVRINYVSDNNARDWIRYQGIVSYIKESFGMGAYLRRVCDADGKLLTVDEWGKIIKRV